MAPEGVSRIVFGEWTVHFLSSYCASQYRVPHRRLSTQPSKPPCSAHFTEEETEALTLWHMHLGHTGSLQTCCRFQLALCLVPQCLCPTPCPALPIREALSGQCS